jgi:hypothetical protein
MISSDLYFDLASDVFISSFLTKICHEFCILDACHMPCPFHPPWFDHHNIWLRLQIRIMQFSPYSCHCLPLRSKNILLTTLFLYTLAIYFHLWVGYHIFDPLRHPSLFAVTTVKRKCKHSRLVSFHTELNWTLRQVTYAICRESEWEIQYTYFVLVCCLL